MEVVKICNKCLKKLPNTLDYFTVNRNRSDGLHNRCKSCLYEYGKEYRRKIKVNKK